MGGSGRQPTAWSLGPPRVHTRNGISVGDQQTYTQTNHATCATVGRILCYGLRCGPTRVFIQPTQAATSLRSVPACRSKIYMLCMHLKHNSCHMSRWPWPMPHPSAICVELPCGSRQPMTGRLATHPSNTGPQTHDYNSVKSEPIKKVFFTGRFIDKFAVKWILKIPPHLAYVATLPCETLMSAKQAINNKLRGSVATYLSCCGLLITKLRKVYC